MSELIFQRGGEDLLRVCINRPRVEVGRGPQNDVAIPDGSISRSQFSIVRKGSRACLVDASGRGTRVNGQRAEEVLLEDGAEIEIGAWRARYRETRSLDEGLTDPPLKPRATADLDPTRPDSGGVDVRIRLRSRGTERVLPMDSEAMTVGTDPRNRIVLEDRFVSSFHLQLTRSRGGFWVRDLGSTNGTLLNGFRVGGAELQVGSVVRLGESELSLEPTPLPGATEGAFEGMIGRDPALLHLRHLIERVAPSAAAVTIFGETGTGKELVARSIHARSLRRDRPFVPVNCAALHRDLIESELFGHEKGAFTGAERARTGAFEEASGGTLFLDEIGELSADHQAKLLRVLESGELRRLGATKTTRVDVRLVAATHVDLLPEVRRGTFREDLYYRLCVFPLVLPPLRRRPSDLVPLANHFLKMFTPAGQSVHFSQQALTKLGTHSFPGNIRELRALVQRALFHRSGAVILPKDIVFDAPYRDGPAEPIAAQPLRLDNDHHLFLPGRTLKQCEEEIVLRAVRRNACKTASASELGISRTTVIKRCRELLGGSGHQ